MSQMSYSFAFTPLPPIPGEPPVAIGLRQMLKLVLRAFRLRCVEAAQVEAPAAEGGNVSTPEAEEGATQDHQPEEHTTMASFNKVILIGNLTRDPQVKHLQSQTVVAEFGLAVNRRWKDQQGQDKEDVTFVDCTAFGRTAEVINQYFTKGKPIFLEGRLKYGRWEDKQGGGKRSKLTVFIENFQFVGGRDANLHAGDDRPEEVSRSSTRSPRPSTRGAHVER